MRRSEPPIHTLVLIAFIEAHPAIVAQDRTPAQWWVVSLSLGAVWLSLCRMLWIIARDEWPRPPRG